MTNGLIQRRVNGFTLIELLVVIAIISILAAILFPVFARARENARRASCMSNLKQIGLGLMMYLQDYDGKYPARYYYNGSSIPGSTGGKMIGCILPPTTSTVYNADTKWILEPYIKSTQLTVCPSWTGDVASKGGGYSYNLVAGVPHTYADVDVLSESTIEEPSLMVAFIDGSWGRDAYPASGSIRVDFCKIPGDSCSSSERYGRHMEGANAAYMDGHVKWNRVNYYFNDGENYPVWQGWK